MKKLLMILLSLSLLVACVPTPEAEFVTNKGDDLLEQKIHAENPLVEQPSFPTAVVDTCELSETSILHIDAKTQTPTGNVFPVYQIRLTSISPEQASTLLKEITSDGYISMFSGTTKANILDAVQHTEAAKARALDKSDLSPAERQELIDEYDGVISELMNQYDGAPDVPDPIGDLSEADRLSATLFSNDGARLGTVFMQLQNEYEDGVSGSKLILDIDLNDRPLAYFPNTVFDSLESCISFCDRLFSDAGMTDYVYSESSENELFYTLHFVKSYGGVLYTPTRRYDGAAYDGEGFSEYIPDESIVIVFGKGTSCIRAFDWYSPSKIESCINENVQLLPFDEILTAFRAHCKSAASWDSVEVEGIIRQEILIDEIRLGYKRIPIKNSQHGFMAVPAWAFCGTVRLTCDPAIYPYALDENNQVTVSLGTDGLCAVINAVDGSLIYSGIRE